MSAWLVSKTHIDLLVTAGLWHGHHGENLRWFKKPGIHGATTWADVPSEMGELSRENADEVGRMLWTENLDSIHYCYPDTLEENSSYPGTLDFKGAETIAAYRFEEIRGPLDVTVVLHNLACFDYQACEHPGHRGSEAYQFVQSLTEHLVSKLPGYDNAPWGFDNRDYFRNVMGERIHITPGM